LNDKFGGNDRSAFQIENPGVTPGFFVGRIDDADVRYWHKADVKDVSPNIFMLGTLYDRNHFSRRQGMQSLI